jgi:hypothetical protein
MSKKILHTQLLGRRVKFDDGINDKIAGETATIRSVFIDRESGDPIYSVELDDGRLFEGATSTFFTLLQEQLDDEVSR